MKSLDTLRPSRWLGSLVLIASLAGCGGNDPVPGSDAASGTLSGTAPSDSGGSSGTPFSSGSGYSILYTAPTIGIDGRSPVTANFDSTSGALTGWQWDGASPAGAESPAIGTLSTSDLNIDGALTLGRWSAGTLGGRYYNLPALTIQPGGGLHWVVGRATASPPTTGVVTYTVSKATSPTFGNPVLIAAVVPLAGSITVDFATGKVALDLTFTYGSGVYTIRTTGVSANPGSSEVSIDSAQRNEFGGAGQISTAASTGTSGYTTYVRGFFAGTSAEQAAIALRVDGLQGGSWASITASLRQAASGGGGGATNSLLTAANCSPGIRTGFSLIAEVTAAGTVLPPVCIDGLSAKPATQAEFCGNTEFQQGLPPGITLNTCSYNPSTGIADVTATLSVAPGVPGIAYTVKYTFIQRS